MLDPAPPQLAGYRVSLRIQSDGRSLLGEELKARLPLLGLVTRGHREHVPWISPSKTITRDAAFLF